MIFMNKRIYRKNITVQISSQLLLLSVADPGFDLFRGGVDFVNRGGGIRKSLKVLKVKVKVILKRALAVFLLKLSLK